MSDETIAVPKELLQILFDTAVGSMDFGSGFLGDEEVTALRQTADLLGVDPMEGTPHEYRKRIVHTFAARQPPYGTPYPSERLQLALMCRWCDKRVEDQVHAEVAP